MPSKLDMVLSEVRSLRTETNGSRKDISKTCERVGVIEQHLRDINSKVQDHHKRLQCVEDDINQNKLFLAKLAGTSSAFGGGAGVMLFWFLKILGG